MKKIMHIFRLLGLLASLLFAVPVYGADAAMQQNVNEVQRVYQSIPDIAADFTQETYVALLDKKVEKKGKFYFKKGGMLRIEYKGDEERHYVSDGTTLWIYTPGDAASLQTYAVSEETVPREALSFMSGFGKLEKEFVISSSSAFKDVPEGFSALHLVPKNKKAQYKSLDTMFNKNHVLVKLKIANLSGNITDYNFSNIKTDVSLKDDFFSLGSGKATPDTLPEKTIPLKNK
jgi:outer membrane lipoprotein-sorting protein